MSGGGRKPSAAKRTVSLFTGKTDLEDPRARDGTYGEPKALPPKRPDTSWTTLSDGWHWCRGGQQLFCRETEGVLSYELHHAGRVAGTFANIIEAARRADQLQRVSR